MIINKARYLGFTLIELIVVIAILGILAAVALPRFVDLQTQARQAKLQAAVGAVRAAAVLFHAQCLANSTTASGACPTTGAPSPAVLMEGVPVEGLSQYPDTTAGGIISAAGLNAGTSATTTVDYTISPNTSNTKLSVAVPSPTAGTCTFDYSPASQSGTAVIAASATITQSACN